MNFPEKYIYRKIKCLEYINNKEEALNHRYGLESLNQLTFSQQLGIYMNIKGREIPKNDKRKVVRVEDEITIITREFTFIIVSATKP